MNAIQKYVEKIDRLNMKRIINMLIISILVGGILNGCGEMTKEQIVENMYQTKVDSVTINMEFELDIDGTVKDKDMSTDIQAELTIRAKDILSSMVMGIDGSAEYDFQNGKIHDEIPIEVYETNESSQKIYFKSPNNQDYSYLELFYQNEKLTFGQDAREGIKDYWHKANLMSDKEVINDVECYVFEYQPSGTDMIDIIDTILSAESKKETWDAIRNNLEEEYGVLLEQALDEADISIKAFVAVDSYYIKRIELSIADVSLGEIAINQFLINLEMSDEDSTEFDIPVDDLLNCKEYGYIDNDAKKAAEELKKTYDEYARRYALCDSDGNEMYTFVLPEECNLLMQSDTGSFYVLDTHYKGVYYRISISDYLCSEIWEYIHSGHCSYEDSRDDFQCEYELLELQGHEIYKAEYSYTSKETGDHYEKFVIFVPYKSQYGTMNHLEIEVNDNLFENWDEYGKKLLCVILDFKEEKVEEPQMSDWLMYINQVTKAGPFSEFTRYYHLRNDKGDDVFKMFIPEEYYVVDNTSYTMAEILYGRDETKAIYVNAWYSQDATNELTYAFTGVNNDKSKTYDIIMETIEDHEIYFLHSYEAGDKWGDIYYVVFRADPDAVDSYYVQMNISPELGREWDNGFKDDVYKMIGVK